MAEPKGHTGFVYGPSFSPDGTRVVTASNNQNNQTARIWDATTGKQLAELKGHTDSVNSASFSPDGTRIVTASNDQTVRIWDATTGTQVAELKGHIGGAKSASFSPDGIRIVTGAGEGTARIWDSVPYRERLPAIEAYQIAGEVMELRVKSQLQDGKTPEEIRVAISQDASLNDSQRQAAGIFIRKEIDRRLAELNREVWSIANRSDATADELVEALEKATLMVSLAPNEASIIYTLGDVQYKNGLFKEALETLRRSDSIFTERNNTQPANVKFIAMTQFKLGQLDEANQSLERLRTLMQDERWANYEPARAILAEATELIDPEAGRVNRAIEGESLKIVDKSGLVSSQDMRVFPKDRWSGNHQLWWRDGKPGDRLKLEIEVSETAEYELQLVLTRARDYGIVQLYWDEEKLGDPIDLFNEPDVLTTGLLSFGTRKIEQGTHDLTIEITGANPKAGKSYMVGLDCVWLKQESSGE